jgi:hypothetical protein
MHIEECSKREYTAVKTEVSVGKCQYKSLTDRTRYFIYADRFHIFVVWFHNSNSSTYIALLAY